MPYILYRTASLGGLCARTVPESGGLDDMVVPVSCAWSDAENKNEKAIMQAIFILYSRRRSSEPPAGVFPTNSGTDWNQILEELVPSPGVSCPACVQENGQVSLLLLVIVLE